MKWLIVLLVAVVSFLEAGSVQWDRRGIHQYCRDVSKRLGWIQTGEGYVHDVPAVSPSIRFSSYQHLSVDEARRLIVSECDHLVDLANRTQSGRTTQITGPFTIKNISYCVFFENPYTNLEYEPPYVAGVYVMKGKVIYKSRNNTTKRYGCIHREPYEEAVRILEAEQAVECR